MKQRYNNFFRPDLNLNSKWWHRLFKVVFFLIISLLIVLIPISYYFLLQLKPSNTKIISNLNEYTKSVDSSTNVLPDFLATKGELGCLDKPANNYKWLSEYSLSKDSYCNKDILSSLDSVLPVIIPNYYDNQGKEREFLKTYVINTIKEKSLVCLINKDDRNNCEYQDIVKYQRNYIFYIQTILFSVLTWVGLVAGGLLFYYKAFIYVLFGKKDKNLPLP